MNGAVSLIVCTHNGSKRLPETLRHLAALEAPAEIPWEVLVFDNGSTDDTTEVVLRHLPLFPEGALRVISVPEPGKSNALVRAIREARHEFFCIVDDDNWVTPDWVVRLNGIFAQHPEIDYCGGPTEAVYETAPPTWLKSIEAYYAIGGQFGLSGEVTDSPGALLWGAGATMRTAAARRLLDGGFSFLLSSRKGTTLASSGDSELCFALRETGCRFWYQEDLMLRHFIPKERLVWSYPLRLMRAMGQSSVMLELYKRAFDRPPYEDSPAWKKTWLFAYGRAVWRWVKIVVRHPVACLRKPEGSLEALEYQRVAGNLSAVWGLRGKYEALREELAHAQWATARRERR